MLKEGSEAAEGGGGNNQELLRQIKALTKKLKDQGKGVGSKGARGVSENGGKVCRLFWLGGAPVAW